MNTGFLFSYERVTIAVVAKIFNKFKFRIGKLPDPTPAKQWVVIKRISLMKNPVVNGKNQFLRTVGATFSIGQAILGR